jgi:hypothetical protein
MPQFIPSSRHLVRALQARIILVGAAINRQTKVAWTFPIIDSSAEHQRELDLRYTP